jgi:hypothetical protein
MVNQRRAGLGENRHYPAGPGYLRRYRGASISVSRMLRQHLILICLES